MECISNVILIDPCKDIMSRIIEDD